MKFKIILFLLLLAFHYSLLATQDTWVKTYDPFYHYPTWDINYKVEDVLVCQDGGYAVNGYYYILDEYGQQVEWWGFLMKTDSDGNLLWAKKDSVSFMDENESYAFVEIENGDFIIIGYTIYGGGYMIKRDSEGNRLWAIPYIDFGANSMCKTNDGNIAIGGRLFANAALRKIDNYGNTIWTKSYEIGTGSNAYSVYQSSDEGYLLTGINYIENDILTIRTNANGDSLWTRTFDGLGGNDQGHCVIQTNEGNIFVSGYVEVPAPDYGFGFLACLEVDGDTLWTKVFDDGLLFRIISILQVSDNNFVLQGGKLVKIDYFQNVIWNEPLTGDAFGGGDRNLQETYDGGFLCTSTINWGDYIVLNKTDSLGQIMLVDEFDIPPDNINLVTHPNPFNTSTTISFLNTKGKKNTTKIQIYNIKGQLVKELEFTHISVGKYEVIWYGRDRNNNIISNGIYFIKLKNSKFNYVKKITKIGE